MKNILFYIIIVLFLTPIATLMAQAPPPQHNIIDACEGTIDGAIDLIFPPLPPTIILMFEWEDENGNNLGDTEDIQNLSPGLYNLTISDQDGCSGEHSFMVQQTTAPIFEIIAINCNGNDGTSTIEIGNSLILDGMSYFYSFDDETPEPLNDYVIAANLESGEHSFSIFNENGCENTLSVQIPCEGNDCFTYNDIHIDCEGIGSGVSSLTVTISYPSELQGDIFAAGIGNPPNLMIIQQENITNPLILYTNVTDNIDFSSFFIQMGEPPTGCNFFQQVWCDFISGPEDPPNIDVVPPIFMNETNHIACYDDGAEICFPYQISDFSPFIYVSASSPTLSISKQIVYSHGNPIAEGVFCFTPVDNNVIGTHEVILTAMDNQPERNIATQTYTIEARCCLLGYDESVTPALVGCNGHTLETGSYTIIPHTNGDCTPQADQLLINGDQQNTITDLDPGLHTFEINFEGTTITEIVNIPSETTSFDVNYVVENTEGYFNYDAGIGRISVTPFNGFGPFYYDWEDCVSFEGIVVDGGEPELSFCDGLEQNERQNLSAGTYTVTITDQHTGCSVVESITISKTNVDPHQVFTNILLEGSFSNPNYLRKHNLLPTKQPYREKPWDYNGSESVADTSDIPSDAVDWVLVEARYELDTTRTVAQAAGFLLEDGNIVSTNGSPLRLINLLENERYYVIIRHRNHLAISSRNSIVLPNTEPTKYDFTTSITKAKGHQQMRELPSGKFAMCAGDFNGDGKINAIDYQGYLNESSSINGYLQSDFNLDKHTTAKDFNLLLNNSGAIGVDWIRYD